MPTVVAGLIARRLEARSTHAAPDPAMNPRTNLRGNPWKTGDHVSTNIDIHNLNRRPATVTS